MNNTSIKNLKSDYGYEKIVTDKFNENYKKTIRFNKKDKNSTN